MFLGLVDKLLTNNAVNNKVKIAIKMGLITYDIEAREFIPADNGNKRCRTIRWMQSTGKMHNNNDQRNCQRTC
jgi:hypothetical protein